MLHTILSLLVLFSFSISGDLKDKSTQQPIAYATVRIVELDKATQTDAQGRFHFSNLPEGNFTLRISHISYETYSVPFSTQTGLGENSIFLEPKTTPTEEVIIRGVRADELTPVSQKTLSKNQIEQTYYGQEMPVLLTQTPSVNYYSDAGNSFGYSYMRLRGIDQTRINFTLNGLPLNEPEDQGVYFANFADFGNSLQSIQVQRGVGTSTWGTALYAGSVNFESINLAADTVASAELQAGYGSFGSYRIAPEYSTGLLKNKLAFYGRYSLVHTDGYKYHSGTNANSFFLSGGYFGKKDFIRFTGFSGFTTNEMAYVPAALADIQQDPRTNYLTKDETDKFSQQLAQLQYTHQFSPFLSVVASGYYIRLQGGYDILFAPVLQRFSVASHFGGGMLNANYSRNQLTASIGIHANTYQRDHFSGIHPNVSERLYTNTGHKNELSAFAKATYTWNRFHLYADVQIRSVAFRYVPDKNYGLGFISTQWNFFNPKAGITYQATKNVSMYASVGKTSREPTRNDLFAGFDDLDTSNLGFIGNLHQVKPESVVDVEAGVKVAFASFTAQVNGFAMEFRNEIAPIGQLSYIGLPLRKNVAQSYRRGVELDLTWKPLPNLTFTQNTAYMQAQIKEYTSDADSVTYRNITPLLSPKWILNQAVLYVLPLPANKPLRGEIELSSRYVSQSFLANDDNSAFTTPAFHILNARLALQFQKWVKLSFLVNNLTDKLYFTSGQVTNNQPYYFVQARRNYFVTLQLNF